METNSVIHLLKENAINRTAARIEVMQVMMSSEKMLSLSEILKRINYTYDRVTVYRILCMFCEKELLYKLVDLQNNAYYRFNALFERDDFIRSHKDEVFFKCIHCGKITFIETPLPEYHLPQGFVKTATNFLIAGYCKHCSQS